eukprot:scaffold136180_cov190-Phaeocystis_antarctica.AAC.1
MVGRQSHGRRRRASARTQPPPDPRRPPRCGPAPPARGAAAHRPAPRAPCSTRSVACTPPRRRARPAWVRATRRDRAQRSRGRQR